jgi:hypothetical protein
MKIATPALLAGAIVVLVASSIAATEGRAEIDYPWCSISSTGQSGMPACRFSTLEQCNAFLAGQAGFCQRNSRIVWQEQQQMIKRGVR